MRGRSTSSVMTSNVQFFSLQQELSWAIWSEAEVIKSSGGSYKTCMRCTYAHLGWRGLTGATGGHGFEGKMADVSRWSK